MKKITAYIIVLMCIAFTHTNAQNSTYDEYADDTAIIATPDEGTEIHLEGKADEIDSEEEKPEYQRKFMQESKLEELRDKPAFKYKDWENDTIIQEQVKKPAKTDYTPPPSFDGTILLWFLGGIILVALILQLSGVNIGRIFSTRSEKNINDDEKLLTENIHEIPFESEIKQAIENKNYKLATRLLYLQSLKLLSDKKLIVWTEQKTNRQYEYEIKDHNIRNHFITITTVFEIVCYGERTLDDDKFLQVHQLFNRFKTQLV